LQAEFLQYFPRAGTEHCVGKSCKTPRYNCIAFALVYSNRWWEPAPGYYWPSQVRRANSIEAYVGLFFHHGYVLCSSSEPEPGFVKAALYALNDKPTHAARQLSNGLWISKLGRDIDVEHTLRALEGPTYGSVVRILRKPTQGMPD
jgi:hypothetical protein